MNIVGKGESRRDNDGVVIVEKKDENPLIQEGMVVGVAVNNPSRLSKMYFFTLEFLDKCLIKLTEALLSVKVWFLFIMTALSTYLLMNKFITGDNWSSINGTVYTVVFACRAMFETTTIQSIYQNFMNKNKEETNSDNEQT